MKRLIVLLLGLVVMSISTVTLRSQSYTPFPDTAVWTVTHCFLFGKLAYPQHRKFVLVGDTVVGTTTYRRVYSFDVAKLSSSGPDTLHLDSLQYEGAWRESGRKIYFIPHVQTLPETLYDFSGDVGDTIGVVFYFGGPTAPHGGYSYLKEIIASVDSVLVNGSYRKRFFFAARSYHPPEYWIEGIGSTFGLLYPFMQITDNVFALSCMSVAGSTVYYDSSYSGSVCGDTTPPSCRDIIITGVGRDHSSKPVHYELYQNYPNPFNPSTTISFDLSQPSHIRLRVFDLLGREQAVLQDGEKVRGHYEVRFDATHLATGVYFYRLEAGRFSSTKKLMVLK